MSEDKKENDDNAVDKHWQRRENQTQREKFAEDLVYTLNHAIVCGATDILDPFIGTWTQQYLGKRISITFHSHDDHHGHDHHHAKPKFMDTLKHWVIGEAVGDVGAVPFTVGLQYVAPGFMQGIQSVAEPVLGPVFRWSANHSAHEWGEKQGLTDDTPEVKARAQEIYRHEVEHLPHAFVWTATAAAGNVLTQKLTGNKAPVGHLFAGKAMGSLGTLVTVLSFRAFMPRTAQKVDRWNSENIAEPTTRYVSRMLGISDDTVERVLEREREFEDGHQLKHLAEKRLEDVLDEKKPDTRILKPTVEPLPPLHLTRLLG